MTRNGVKPFNGGNEYANPGFLVNEAAPVSAFAYFGPVLIGNGPAASSAKQSPPNRYQRSTGKNI
jgi:hypothetical protein